MKKLLIIFAIIMVVAGTAFVIQGPRSGGPDRSQQPVAENTVAMQDYKFTPERLTVKKGTTITWENRDNTRHNVVSAEDSVAKGLNGPLIGQGQTWTHEFTEVGTYTYFCSPHPYMKGTIEVTE